MQNQALPSKTYTIDKLDVILPIDGNFILNFIICPICNQILINPTQCIVCNNYFCENCINEWIKTNCHCFKCENNKNFNKSKIMQRLLSCLKVKCNNKCGEIISYNNLTKHYEEECSKIDFKQQYFLIKKERDALIEQLNNIQNTKEGNNNEFLSTKHSHKLSKENSLSFLCNVCKKVYYYQYSFICKSCDFNICLQCKQKETKGEIRINAYELAVEYDEDDFFFE